MKCDFGGWATKNNLKCADGRIIRQGAFEINDGKKVPLVWNHQHNDPSLTLGHAILENRDEGVYAYCFFNDSPKAKDAKEAVKHGDISSLSIWANNLTQKGPEVIHGVIREVSLVHAGANPGAFIESVLRHGVPLDEDEEEGIIYSGSDLYLSHATDNDKKEDDEVDGKNDEKTVGEVLNTLTDEQKAAVAIIINQALEEGSGETEDEEEDEEEMKHNIFEGEEKENGGYLIHADFNEIMTDAKRIGSFRSALNEYLEDGEFLEHASKFDTTGMTVATGTQTYGFNDPNMLFPEFKTIGSAQPEWLSRNMDWVTKLMSVVGRTPFSRIKSVYADITEDEARARGYIKGKQKKSEVFTTLKRTTDPQTVYKLQKMDRDDILDITDFDVVAWIRQEMRVMLNEEIARAVLIGDGRQSDDEYKISESHIRPVVSDVPLFNTIVKVSSTGGVEESASRLVDAIIRSRKNYKGTGTPIFWTTEDTLTEMLLLKDKIGQRIYKTEAELATTLRVREIVTVEPMEGHKVTVGGSEYPLVGTIVNLADYKIGADKGGEINNFEDFDIDFNQQKYLIETRISGALTRPFSAITFVWDGAAVASASED